MIFGTLAEYVIVNVTMSKSQQFFLESKQERKITGRKNSRISDASVSVQAVPDADPADLCKWKKRYVERAHFIDNVSKFLFPAVFMIFNFVYWYRVL